jgi:pyridoxal 5'-phosphate synthase pdxT subunit
VRLVTIGVLALQGDVREHLSALAELGIAGRRVRAPAELAGLSGIILPGGESTTLSLLLSSSGLFEPLAGAIDAGLPVFGTCAGLVLLAREVHGGRDDQRGFEVLDCSVLRNGYGRQRDSFEGEIEVAASIGGEGTMPAVFIRAPLVETVGKGVEVLGWMGDPSTRHPVVCRQGSVLASAFHPELTTDRRLHRYFAQMVAASRHEAGARGLEGAARH